ncbi:MAG: HAD family hydrolase [Clostridia bacterium]|nr:MAG: HAD family hydrolase [Clostridia bacterium]
MLLRVERIKGLLFDVHDTIVDKGGSAALECALDEAAAFWEEAGYPEAAAGYKKVWRDCILRGREILAQGREFSFEEWHRQIFAGLGIPYSYELAVRLNDRFMRGFAGRTRPIPGAAEVLGRLARQYRLGVVSNSMAENTLIDLARTGLRQYFHVLIISSQVGYRKPHPVIYLAALQAMNVAPEEVVFVGDNWEEDVVGPKEHGMQAIWLKPAGKEAEEWRFRLPGVAVAGALEDIPGMLLKPGG